MVRTRIVITGASRGIGEALAREYARPDADLVLIGRDAASLEMVAAACRTSGARTETVALDIRDRAAMAEGMRRIDDAAPVDLLIANAGIQKPTSDDPGRNLAAFDEIETNFLGALNTAVPLAERMAARGRGQIAVMSSLAAYAPLPDSPGYSSSKAGLLVWGLAMRARLRPVGVRVNVICPGYIDAGMGQRYDGWKPFMLPADKTARKVRQGLERNKAVIAFPFPLTWIAGSTQLVPEWMSRLTLKSFRFRVNREA